MCYAFEKKKFFSATIILWKKVILSCLKMNVFVKRFKRWKIDFWCKAAVELVKSPIWYLFKPRKVGWSDYGRRGLHEGGGNCLKYLKRGWNRKEGRGNKEFKKGGKLGQGLGALKREGWNPLTNYGICQKFTLIVVLNPLSANPTKWSVTLKQFVGNSRQIAWVCLTILWGWRLKG